LIASTLRVLAMLVSIVARFFGMRLSLLPRECHTDVEPHPLPRTDRDTIKETTLAATHGNSQEGLTLRTIAQAIVDSKGEGGLTGSSHAQQQHSNSATQQYRNNATLLQKTPPTAGRGTHNPLNRSSSGSSRGSRLERLWSSQDSYRHPNRDSRRKAENDPLLGLWLKTQPA
jgi:hypothetical protein